MLVKYFSVTIILAMIVCIIPADAVQLDATISKNSKEFVPTYTFTRIVSFQYSENSKLAELFAESQQKIIFDINSQNGKVLIEQINSKLEAKSFVKVTDISGEYSVVITPQKESASIQYKIVIHPTMQGHFVSDSVLDSEWRGFDIDGEIQIETKFGILDINSPMSAFIRMPQMAEYLSIESDAMKLLDSRLLDASGLSKLSLSKWESIFDPTAKMSDAKKFGFLGSSVITNYSMGICTVYLGFCQDRDYVESFEIDGESYTIRSIESQDDGTIVIEGYVKESSLGDVETFVVTDNASSVVQKDDPQVTMLYTVSGVGIVVAAGFFLWSGKKSKETPSEQTGIDPKDLYATAAESSAGGYQTNRGITHLR